ncbi:MAG: CDP-alcohol phosphatidyltransferase family protein [Polyangiaceae bacterium]
MSATETLSPLKGALSVRRPTPARLRGTIWQRSWLAKTFYDALLALANRAAKAHVSPDVLTALSLVTSFAAAGCAAYGKFVLAAALLLLGGCLDLLDGAVARLTNQASRWGALLDSSVDRVADALPLAGLVLYYSPNRLAMALPLLSIVSSFTISYVRARSESLGATLPQTFMRRAERMLLLVVALLLGAVSIPMMDAWVGVADAPMLIWVSLTMVLNLFGCGSILLAAHRALARPVTKPAGNVTESKVTRPLEGSDLSPLEVSSVAR